jgi:hypothetical protein
MRCRTTDIWFRSFFLLLTRVRFNFHRKVLSCSCHTTGKQDCPWIFLIHNEFLHNPKVFYLLNLTSLEQNFCFLFSFDRFYAGKLFLFQVISSFFMLKSFMKKNTWKLKLFYSFKTAANPLATASQSYLIKFHLIFLSWGLKHNTKL